MEKVVQSLGPALLAKAASFVKDGRLPGAAVGVVHADELAWSAGIGFSDMASARPAGTDGLYRIASITKTFTATAIMQLRDAGRLHLDDPAVKYLPELAKAVGPGGDVRRITLRHMLSHESGLQGDPPGNDWLRLVHEGRPEVTLQRATEIRTALPPNAQTKYSNLGYQFLGLIVERASGTPYPDYVRSRLLEPLGMLSTSFDPLPREIAGRRATGYNGRSFSDELDPCPESPLMWSEGGLWSSVNDLARWISFQLGAGKADEILREATRVEMHRARYIEDAGWTCAFGIGWYTVRREKVKWVQHSGGLYGFISNLCFDPETKTGAIVLLNGIGGAPTLSMDLATMARDAVKAAPPEITPPAAMPREWADFLGMYVDPLMGEICRLEWRDGKVMIVSGSTPNPPVPLAPTDEPGVFLVEPGDRASGEMVRFERGRNGKVRAMIVPGSTLPRIDVVE